MNKALSFMRGNAIAIAALFIALGGTSYAVVSVPAGSVGSKQLRNGAITPVKLNPGLIGGSVRAWVDVASNGKLLAGHGFRSVSSGDNLGGYDAYLTVQNVKGCAAFASVILQQSPLPATGGPGYANAVLVRRLPNVPYEVGVDTYNAAGQRTPQGFVAEVLC
jgi:hypothetical protein